MTSLTDGPALDLRFEGEVIQWRGPSPYFFVAMPHEPSAAILGIAKAVSYGWGCIPARISIDDVSFATALIPKDGRYLVPLKDVVRKRLGVSDGQVVAVDLTIGS
jgi:hypothetical protein